MNYRLRLEHILKESGWAPDLPCLLDLLLSRPALRRFAFRYLRFKFTPLILDRIRNLDAPLEERARLFTAAISFINAGETYKTTGACRTKLVDQAIIRHAARFDSVHLVEVGASDGVASIELIDTLPNLREITLTDRHPSFFKGLRWPISLLLDGDHRLLGVRFLGLYINLSPGGQRDAGGFTEISTLNPLLAESRNIENIQPFDVRLSTLAEPVEIIKCANLFNRKYFPDEIIASAVQNLGKNLLEGGLLFISQNNERYQCGESYFVMEKHGDTLCLIEDKNEHEAVFLFRQES